MTATKLGRIELENGDTYFVLLEINRQSSENVSLSIIMTNIERCWKSELESHFFRSQSQRTKCSVDNYLNMIVSCLTGTTSDDTIAEEGSKYICQVKELSNNDAELTWKRQLLEDDVSFKLGTTTLRSTNTAENLRTILAFGVNRIKELEKLTEEQRSEEKVFLREQKNLREKLDSCVTAKEEMERDLYAKFVDVLNEKKAEIRRLRASKSTNVEKDVTTKETKRTIAKISKDSDPDDPTSGDEDEGGDYDTPITKRKVVVVSKPKEDEDLLFQDSSDESLDTMKVSLRSPVKKRKQNTNEDNGTKRSSYKPTDDVFKASTSKESTTNHRTRSRKSVVESGRFDSAGLLNDMQ